MTRLERLQAKAPRLDPCTAVREHNRPKDRRTVPRDERPEAGIEKRSADGLDVGEVTAHAAGGFQRFDLHRCATRWRFRSAVSRGPGGSLEEAQAFRHYKANDEQRDHTRRHLLMRAHPRLCLTCCD